jgi:hypothetical protein
MLRDEKHERGKDGSATHYQYKPNFNFEVTSDLQRKNNLYLYTSHLPPLFNLSDPGSTNSLPRKLPESHRYR